MRTEKSFTFKRIEWGALSRKELNKTPTWKPSSWAAGKGMSNPACTTIIHGVGGSPGPGCLEISNLKGNLRGNN